VSNELDCPVTDVGVSSTYWGKGALNYTKNGSSPIVEFLFMESYPCLYGSAFDSHMERHKLESVAGSGFVSGYFKNRGENDLTYDPKYREVL
jgi:hypothetical protein